MMSNSKYRSENFISGLYFMFFLFIFITLVIYIYTFYKQDSLIQVTSAVYGQNCKKVEHVDITEELKIKCNGLSVCDISYTTVGSNVTCEPELKIHWSCQSDKTIELINYKTKAPDLETSRLNTKIKCPARRFKPPLSV